MYFKNTILASACDLLKEHGIPDYEISAEQLLMHALGGVSRSTMLMTDNITVEQYNIYMALIDRRKDREPLDRIIGNSEFLGLIIPYNDNVLTPRCETEILADMIVRDISQDDNNIVSVLDLCCGSGCIGLAIAHNSNSKVSLADISNDALEIAKSNYDYNVQQGKNFHYSPTFILSDMFADIDGKYDIIVSNPPYIPTKDCLVLEPEVREYDPILALDGGHDGLEFYRIIAKDCSSRLNTNGKVYLEIGIGQGSDVVSLFNEYNFDVKVIPDYSGIDRFIIAKKRENIC